MISAAEWFLAGRSNFIKIARAGFIIEGGFGIKRIHSICIILMLVLFCVMCVQTFSTKLENTAKDSAFLLQDSWQYGIDGQIKGETDDVFSTKVPVNSQKTWFIERKLPNTKDYNTLMFRTVNQAVRVFIDGEQIYEYGVSTPFFGKTPGTVCHLVRLDSNSYGKTVTMEYKSSYRKYDGKIFSIHAGTKYGLISKVIESNLVPLLSSLLLIVFGFFFIIFYFFALKNEKSFQGVFHLAAFAVCLGTWNGLENAELFAIMIGRPLFSYMLTFVSLYSAIMFLLYFLKSIKFFKNKKLINNMIIVAGVLISITLLSHVFGIADLMETLPIIYTVILAYSIWLVSLGYLQNRGNFSRSVILVFIGAIIFFFCIIIDIVLFKIGVEHSFIFVQFGIIAAILALSIVTGRFVTAIRQQALQNAHLKYAAYNDKLTGLKNRTSFENDIIDCCNNKNSFYLVNCDVNGLKDINDRFGHSCGDQLLVRAARALSGAFGDCGTVYRMGGDEFYIIALCDNEEQLNIAMEKLHKIEELHEYKTGDRQLSIAVGWVCCNDIEVEKIKEAIFEADRQMYINKEKIKTNK